MSQDVKVLTAETKQGRLAITEVMHRSYIAEIDSVPLPWARVLVVDDVPISFILVDPDRQMEHPGGDLRYAFICDVATREDRRREGHFRRIMEHMFSSLHAAGIPLVVTHGRYPLFLSKPRSLPWRGRAALRSAFKVLILNRARFQASFTTLRSQPRPWLCWKRCFPGDGVFQETRGGRSNREAVR